MTSFGAEIVTFKGKGHMYYDAGSLLPFPDGQYKFLQICFIGDANDELNACCGISTDIKSSIVSQLQEVLPEKNPI